MQENWELVSAKFRYLNCVYLHLRSIFSAQIPARHYLVVCIKEPFVGLVIQDLMFLHLRHLLNLVTAIIKNSGLIRKATVPVCNGLVYFNHSTFVITCLQRLFYYSVKLEQTTGAQLESGWICVINLIIDTDQLFIPFKLYISSLFFLSLSKV